jgi:putative nucleotidyltransferase with HDIG domain
MRKPEKRLLSDSGIIISDILDKSDTIPAAPGLVGRILALTAEPDFSMEHLVSLVRMDPALTAYVLRMCNSPYYGLRHKVASLDHAIAVLGVNALVDVVLSSGLLKVFSSNSSQDGYMLCKGQLWRHSVATALIAQNLAGRLKIKEANASVTFTAALLHDTGKLALNQFVNDSLYDIESLIHEHNCTLVAAEREILGIDHANLGGLIMEKWAFPEEIVTSVTYHHDPLLSPVHTDLVKLVALSNMLAVSAENGKEQSAKHAPVTIAQLMADMNMNPEDEDNLISEVIDWLKPAVDMLSIF